MSTPLGSEGLRHPAEVTQHKHAPPPAIVNGSLDWQRLGQGGQSATGLGQQARRELGSAGHREAVTDIWDFSPHPAGTRVQQPWRPPEGIRGLEGVGDVGGRIGGLTWLGPQAADLERECSCVCWGRGS